MSDAIRRDGRARSMAASAILMRSAARRMSEAVVLAASTAFAVFALAVFAAAAYSPSFKDAASSVQTAYRLLAVSTVAVAFFVALSGWFYAEHYLRRRKRELASWILLGMGKAKAFAAISAEFAASGIVSLAAGLALGALFSRFFAIVLAALMSDRSPVEIAMGWPSVAAASIACAAQWAIASARAAYDLRRASLAELMKAERLADAAPGASSARRAAAAAAGAALLVAGYACAAFAPGGIAGLLMLPVLAVVIAGTFLAFRALLPAVVARIRIGPARRSAAGLVAAAQVSFRARRNARLLAFAAVLAAMAATSLGAVLALDIRDEISTRRICPHGLELAQPSPESIAAVERILASRGVATPSALRRDIRWLRGSIDASGRASADDAGAAALLFASASWDAAIEPLGEARAGAGTLPLRAYDNGDDPLPSGRAGASPPLSVLHALHAAEVTDAEYERLRAEAPGREEAASVWDGLPAPVLRAASAELKAAVPSGLISRADMLDDQGRLYGVMLFIGAFLSAVFIMAAASLLTFRSIEDSRDDGERYLSMLRIGAPAGTIRRALLLQNAAAFGLPLAVGLCHTAFALVMMRNISGYANLVPTLIVSALLAAAMAAAALFATNKQEAMVSALVDRT
jgi:putative ABC transport system permease protein